MFWFSFSLLDTVEMFETKNKNNNFLLNGGKQ